MTKLAIMQPYLFPYIGYFRLLHSVDNFLCLDDVNFIKKGFIHRNKLVFNGQESWFSVPLQKVSQNKEIRHILIEQSLFEAWQKKFFQSFTSFYKKMPHFEISHDLAQRAFSCKHESIADLAQKSIELTCDLLDCLPKIGKSSDVLCEKNEKCESEKLFGQDRIIALCKKMNARQYINLSGGIELYKKEHFANEGITLFFLSPEKSSPPSAISIDNPLAKSYTPYVSILDMLARYGPDTLKKILQETTFQ